jgi:hypothetical protein
VHLQLGFIVVDEVEKMPCGVQWPMNHLPSHKNNSIFNFWGMPLKMNDISVFVIFIFIQIDISASLSCICNHKPLCSCLCNYKLSLLSATKDTCIYSCKNGWFGHNSQMHELEWIGFLVVTTIRMTCFVVNLVIK